MRTSVSIRILLAIAFLMLSSCDPWVAYSPFESQLDKAYHGNTEKNLALINTITTEDSRTFKVALLSDPHYHYSHLDDAITHINANGEYAFAIVVGDLTENGLKQEFVYFYESMSRLKIPYLTVIGNHDYLANGESVYSQMFGSYNYSFVFNKTKFILFDNTTVESGKEPDLAWLTAELEDVGAYDHVIPFAHIPPYDTQMADHYGAYHDLMVSSGISLSIHGHRHVFSIEETYGSGVEYVTVSSPQKSVYTELIISPSGLEVKKIEY